MKKFIKENVSTILIVLALVILLGFLVINIFFAAFPKDNAKETKMSFIERDISSATEITCKYPQILIASYNNGKIIHTLPNPETNPMIFTFSKLNDSQSGKLSFIDSTQTITNVDLVKLKEDNEKIIYAEGTGETYLTIHTIYKQTGISTYTKNTNLLGTIPVVSSAMGSCVGY